ncbi:MAG: hypothetical protein NZ585_14490 [Chloracidobacterium sp.]|nr:hypothetical protein [Chloracidobacterium sp.]MDW8216722.1 hypothetical protein [Acidobacteriota bacterium]
MMTFSSEHRRLATEAHAHLREAERYLSAVLDGHGDQATFEAACDALNVAAVKLRFIQLELAANEEAAVQEATTDNASTDRAEDDTLSPD